MARTLYIASTNPGKLRDFSLAAASHGISILPLPGLNAIEAPAEDGPTFADIACDKAIYYSRFLPGEMVLADDSGLEVDFLTGAPGVRSARYAADAGFHEADSPDANNNLLLLQQLAGVADNERGGRYRCALAVAQDGSPWLAAEGAVEGRILTAPRGSFMCLPWTTPWRKSMIGQGGHIATAGEPFAPYWNSCPESSLSPNRAGPNLDGASVGPQ
jgi:XTP/dITP diphosphohydrolase